MMSARLSPVISSEEESVSENSEKPDPKEKRKENKKASVQTKLSHQNAQSSVNNN